MLPPGSRPTVSPQVEQLYSFWVAGNGKSRATRRYHLLFLGAGQLARTLDLEEAYAELASSLHFNVALAAPRRLFIHAGVVVWQGQAIVIPGRSRSGKSELVAALVRSGAVYYSDEYAVLDAQGLVHPYAKPLSLRGNGSAFATAIAVQEFGEPAARKPVPLGLVAVIHYRHGARLSARPLTPGQALLSLLNNTIVARLRPEFALEILSKAASGAVALKGRRGEAEDTAPRLLQLYHDNHSVSVSSRRLA